MYKITVNEHMRLLTSFYGIRLPLLREQYVCFQLFQLTAAPLIIKKYVTGGGFVETLSFFKYMRP